MAQQPTTHREGGLVVTTSSSNSVIAHFLFFILSYIVHPLNAVASILIPLPKEHRTPVPRGLKNGYIISSKELDHCIQIYEVTPSNLEKPSTRVVYIPGTGYSQPASSQHIRFCAEVLAKRLNAKVTVVLHPFARTGGRGATIWPSILDVYRSVAETVDEGTRLILGGDSSGSCIALSIAQSVAAEGGRAPDKLLLVCPSTVFMLDDSASRKKKEAIDPLQDIIGTNQIHADWIEGTNWSPDDPRVSPLYGDFAALKKAGTKLCCVVAGRDILEPDAQLMRKECVEAGVEGDWLVEENMFHVFPLTWSYGLPEAKTTLEWMVKSLQN